MKNLCIILLACIFSLSSCKWHRVHGSGTIKTEIRDLPAFQTISCDGAYNVQIECQEKQALAIETDDNLLPFIKTEVTNNSLRIFTRGNLEPSEEIKIVVSVPDISEFTVHGSVHGNINNINNNELFVEINGSSRLHLSGKTAQMKIDISGSSKIDASSLVTENAKVHINGSGDVHVYATNSIDAHINGSGKIKYSGEPKNVNQEVNGSGRIVKD